MVALNKKSIAGVLFVTFYLGLILLLYFLDAPLEYLKDLALNESPFAPFIIILISFLEVIVAPVSVLPLLPALSILFGPFWAATYTLIGWFLGSILAFYIARKLGRPVLGKFISLESVDKYEKFIPKRMEFWWVLLLRVVIFADVLSYALGLTRISFWKFALATFIGFTPSIYVVAYAGEAFLNQNFGIFVTIFVVFAIIFTTLSYAYYKKSGVKNEIENERQE